MNQANMSMDRRIKRGMSTTVVLSIVAIIVVAGLGVALMRGGGETEQQGMSAGVFDVRRGSFDITVPATGELEALSNAEIRNQLEVSATIMEIVDEGITVNKGDVLIRFNDDELKDRIKDEEDDVAASLNALVAAQAKLEITIKEQESELEKADLKITLAELALNAWEEGDAVSKRSQLALDKEIAQKDFAKVAATFEASKDLLQKKFISLEAYRDDEMAMIKARAKLDQAELDAEVYEKYTYIQEEKQKKSDLDQARAERERVGQFYEAQVVQAKSEVESREHALASDEERLARLRRQLEYCTVFAPSDGLVVYATSLESGRHGRDEPPPQVGTAVSRNRRIMLLPDTSQMIAAIKVNEALVGLIEAGQQVLITSDALPDVMLTGTVRDVGVLAETGGWRDPNRRDYTVSVLIEEGNEHGLKPSMRATGEIFIDSARDVLHVPVPAISMDGGQAYVFVPQGVRFARRPVSVGRASEMYVEVLSGLEEGEQVLLREPSPEEIIGEDASGPSEVAMGDGAGRRERPRGSGRPARASAGG
jgi:multidrug efflux pump subunit AcrA (membrane-fusion protein)